MSFLYSIFILPIEFIYKYIYLFCTMFTNSYGIGLFVLSAISSIAFLPLARFALACQAKENEFHAVAAPQIKTIKKKYSGKERNDAINRLYKRYAYHPIMGIRSAFGVLLQVPFLTGAYYMISSLEEIKGHSFLCIADLSQPDGLLFGLNLLPIIMTIINIGVVFTTKGLQRKDIIQALVIAAFFLVLLYPAPSALLIFWTMNNILFLVQNIITVPSFITTSFTKNSTPYLERISIFFILLFLAPVFFIWAVNAHMYTIEMLMCGFLTLILFYIFPLFILGSGIDFLLRKTESNNICKIITFIIVAVFTYLVLRFIIPYKGLFISKMSINIFFICTILAFLFIATKFSIKYINIFCAFILVVSLSHFSYSKFLDDNSSVKFDSSITAELKHTPNIYWIYLESYHDIDTMKRVYGINPDSFVKDLNSLGFTYYPNVLSNGPATILSLYTAFTMQPYFRQLSRGNLDVSPSVMSVLVGQQDNTLLSYLQQQGYNTISTFKSFYDTIEPTGELIDYSFLYDAKKYYSLYDSDKKNFNSFYLTSYAITLRTSLVRLSDTITKFLQLIDVDFFGVPKKQKGLQHSFDKKVCAILEQTNDITNPKFVFMDGGVFHSPSDGSYNWSMANSWIKSNKYKNAVEKENHIILKSVEMIEKEDPNAIIILMGDHGAWALRGLQLGKTHAEIQKNLEKAGYSLADLVSDQYGIFLAIKMPSWAKQDISFGLPLSPANVFRHIFAAINNDKAILETNVENISSTYQDVILARDGKVLPVENEE